jgi:hypothetical protein
MKEAASLIGSYEGVYAGTHWMTTILHREQASKIGLLAMVWQITPKPLDLQWLAAMSRECVVPGTRLQPNRSSVVPLLNIELPGAR